MRMRMEYWILTSKNSAKLKRYYFHAEFLEVRYYDKTCTYHICPSGENFLLDILNFTLWKELYHLVLERVASNYDTTVL